MRRIAIVGSGQAGLILGIGLVDAGYTVTLFADRTSEAILHGKPMGMPVLFEDALEIERNLKLNFWDDQFLDIEKVCSYLCDPQGNPALVVSYNLEQRWQAVDLRLKYFAWIQEFEKRGGELVIQNLRLKDLEDCTQNYDLVVVAAGKASFSKVFERDAQRSTHDRPARFLAAAIVTGLKRNESDYLTHQLKFIPGVGEIYYMPFYDKGKGRSDIVYFGASPGVTMDCFRGVQSGEELLEVGKQLIQQLTPWDYETVEDIELKDHQAWLCGAITPTVRKPIGRLNSGATVMAIGDVAILNDPLSGQGANNATKMAHLVTQRIIEHGNQCFDGEWMQAVFDEFWEYSQYVNAFTDFLLKPPAHMQDIMVAAAQNTDVARDFFQGFNHPPNLFPWLFKPEEAKKYLEQKKPILTKLSI